MRRPDFFIVGAPKCGTTAMNDYLKQHPEIYIPNTKDIYYFGADINTSSRTNTEEKYLSYFAEAKDEKRVGEASAWYLYSKLAAAEIQRFCPYASIIIMLRNPVDMLYSLHSQFLYEVLENITDFKKALDAEEDRKRGLRIPRGRYLRGLHFTKELLFYREVAAYTQQIQRYLDTFGRENVHIIIYDDFRHDTARIYKETLHFLGVKEDFQPVFDVVNANKRLRSAALKNLLSRPPQLVWWMSRVIPRHLRQGLFRKLKHFNVVHASRASMAPHLRRSLQAEFTPEVERLSTLLGRDLTNWSKD